MRGLMRGIIGLVGLFNIVIGLGFLLIPAKLATAFFLTPIGTQGLATLRADFPGFFIGASLFALAGAIRNKAAPLLVPLVLVSLALFGRFVSLALDGFAPSAVQPMVVETVMILILLAGFRTLRAPQAA